MSHCGRGVPSKFIVDEPLIQLSVTLLLLRSQHSRNHPAQSNLSLPDQISIFSCMAETNSNLPANDKSMGESPPSGAEQQSKCLFCRIANNQDPSARLLYQEDGIVIFSDIRPAAAHHYLIVPQQHVKDPKRLGSEDIELVEKLVSVGKEFLRKQGGDVTQSRIGFHWPPFNSISHLHLHVISPVQGMGLIGSLIFRPNSFWFVTAEWLLNRLKGLKPVL